MSKKIPTPMTENKNILARVNKLESLNDTNVEEFVYGKDLMIRCKNNASGKMGFISAVQIFETFCDIIMNRESAGKADEQHNRNVAENREHSISTSVRPETDLDFVHTANHPDNKPCPRCHVTGYIAGLEKAKEICFDQNQRCVTFREEDGLAIEKRVLAEIEKVKKK